MSGWDYTETDFHACMLALGSVWASDPHQDTYWSRVGNWFRDRWPDRYVILPDDCPYEVKVNTNQMDFMMEFYDWQRVLSGKRALYSGSNPDHGNSSLSREDFKKLWMEMP